MKQNLLNLIALILLLAASAAAQTDNKQGERQIEELQSSGGTFTLEKTVVAGGGRELAQMPTNLHGTAGQVNSGIQSIGGQFSLYSGFWTPEILAPTAAQVVAGGRILTTNGKGIRNVRITITFPSGETRATLSTALGYYSFTDVPAGGTYVFSVSAKHYTFAAPSRVQEISDDAQNINFVANASVRFVDEKIEQ